MKVFRHTSREPRMWRGWFKNGHAIEMHWGREPFGIVLGESDNDGSEFRRQLWVGLGFWQIFIPLWRIDVDDTWDREETAWGVRADRESIWLRFGLRSKFLSWPWCLHTLRYEQQMPNGSWVDVSSQDAEPYQEQHLYTYTLKSGDIQHRTATVSKRRHILTWTLFKLVGWPRWSRESMDVNFDDEVGERSGSWKGGCIGCAWDLRAGESLEQALRRMERERKF